MSANAPASAATLRLFYALWPSASTRAALAQFTATRAAEFGASLIPAENYHVTIAFVGNVLPERLPVLRRIGAAIQTSSFQLSFDAIEFWPKPEVIVAAARHVPPPLQALWADLHARLAADGFALEPKRLRPHVTLARKVTQAPVSTVMGPLPWVASHFSLVLSPGGSARSVYTVVETWPLLDERRN